MYLGTSGFAVPSAWMFFRHIFTGLAFCLLLPPNKPPPLPSRSPSWSSESPSQTSPSHPLILMVLLTQITSPLSPDSILWLGLVSECPWQARTSPIFPSVSIAGPWTELGICEMTQSRHNRIWRTLSSGGHSPGPAPGLWVVGRAGIRTHDSTRIALLPSPHKSTFSNLLTWSQCFVMLAVNLVGIVTSALLGGKALCV